MSEHFVKREEPPPGLCSFTKIRLGWISPEQVLIVKPGETAYTFLSPLSRKGERLVVKIPLKSNQYYLIENRQPIGYDRVLPDSGIVILKVNPEAVEGSGTVQIMNANKRAPHFSQATFRLDRENRNLFVDEKSAIAVVPIWAEEGKQGVLITTLEKGKDALEAALMIQRLLQRLPEPRSDGERQIVEECLASFEIFDFKRCVRIAMKKLAD